MKAYPFAKLVDRLKQFYESDVPVLTRIASEERSPFLVLIGCLLSLRTKDETTEKAMERLMKRARTPDESLSIPTRRARKNHLPRRLLPQQVPSYQRSFPNDHREVRTEGA